MSNNKAKSLLIPGLYLDLQHTLFGQHLVAEPLLSALSYHLQNAEPERALVLSFQGGPGTGKNFVSSMLADSLRKNGLSGRFIHNTKIPHNPLKAEVSYS